MYVYLVSKLYFEFYSVERIIWNLPAVRIWHFWFFCTIADDKYTQTHTRTRTHETSIQRRPRRKLHFHFLIYVELDKGFSFFLFSHWKAKAQQCHMLYHALKNYFSHFHTLGTSPCCDTTAVIVVCARNKKERWHLTSFSSARTFYTKIVMLLRCAHVIKEQRLATI